MIILYASLCVILIGAYFFYQILRGNVALGKIADASKASDDEIRILDEINALKSSIKDLELEVSIGRIDQTNFEILKKEYLQKWLQLEQVKPTLPLEPDSAVQITPVNFCPGCGAKIADPQWDKYCRNCGVKIK